MSNPITLSNPDLWRKIESFEIDEGAPTLTFAARLARENGWSHQFARRVVIEYKRFVYLAMVAGHRVTPSEHVDQAWHLHLTYTDSYWKRLCSHVLPRALDHTPTRGGNEEDQKFEDWYSRTLHSYEREFGSAPPRDIWPDAGRRFDHDLRWRRVNTADHVVLRRRTVGWFVVLAGLAACVAATVGLILSVRADTGPERWVTVVGVGGLLMLLVGAIVAGRASRCGGGCRGSDSGGWVPIFLDFGFGAKACSGGDAGCGADGGGCGGGGCGGGCGG